MADATIDQVVDWSLHLRVSTGMGARSNTQILDVDVFATVLATLGFPMVVNSITSNHCGCFPSTKTP